MHFILKTAKKFFFRIDVPLFLLCAIVLIAYPSIDLNISSWFFDSKLHQFSYQNQALVHFSHQFFAKLPIPLLIVLIFSVWRAYRRSGKAALKNSRALFLLLCLLVGPGLLVNTFLKDNSIGRARPSQVENFSGNKVFTPAFVYSGQCDHNCSFVSGHAAMGFFFIALGWAFASPALFYTGVGVGLISGAGRIIQGGHFFSDVIFAFWAVYLVTFLLGELFKLTHPLCIKAKNRERMNALTPVTAHG